MREGVIVLLATIAGAAGGWVFTEIKYGEALDRVDLLTPVVVMDATGALEKLNVKSSPEEIAAAMKKVRDQTERLKDNGFVVLKPNAVMAVPEAIHVKFED